MMQFLEEEIRRVAETVWDSVLGTPLVRAAEIPPAPERVVSGCVHFTGAWEGAVTLECSAEFARAAAATMFGVDLAGATASDIQDAMGELTNMTGGNVKALLPDGCRLSLPTVVEGTEYATRITGSELLTSVAFKCQGSPVVVRLLKKSDNGTHRGGGMSDDSFPHRREFSRVPVHLRAEVRLTAGRQLDGTMEHVSLKGGFFRTAAHIPEGAACDVRMRLEGTEIAVHAQGTVVRPGEGGVAIQFLEIVGIDSLEHLRNLILFNASDPHQVEREFHDHLGLKRDA
jgi:chemotaxis protein CheX